MEQIKVRQMISERSGNAIANQFIIETKKGTFFQSYDSVIAFKPFGDGKILLDEETWDYSVTTRKYRNQFLHEGIEDTRKKIDAGDYLLTNLNK